MKKIIYIGTDKWSEQLEEFSSSDSISIVHSFIPSNSITLLDVCKRNKLPYTKTNNVNNHLSQLKALNFDIFVVIGHPFLLKKKLLDINPGIGFHPSLLPKRRGRAPLNWAIIDGLKESGVSLFKLETGADNGHIIFQKKFIINDNDHVTDLISRINKILKKNLLETVLNWPNLIFSKQDETKATYTNRRYPNDGEIVFDMSAEEAYRLVRALTGPYPSAFIRLKNGEKLYVNEVSLKDGR